MKETINWSSPYIFEKQLDKKTPLPVLKVRKRHNPLKENYAVQVEAEAEEEAERQAERQAEVLESESESFLEVIINSDESEATRSLETIVAEQPAVKVPEIESPVAFSEPEIITVEEKKVSDIEVEEAEAVVREVYLYECEEEGWLLDGITDLQGNPDDNLRFKGREYIGGMTVFSFYPYKTGFFMVNLRRSDYSAGTVSRKTLRLEVSLNVPETAAVSEELPAAVNQEDLQEQPDQVPQVAEKVEVDADVDVILSVSELLTSAEALESAGDCAGAVELLNDSIESIQTEDLDVLYFKLGQLYENCSGLRDERTALKFYKKIVDYYPVSNYWIESKERIKYLERNYIFIR